MAKINKLLKTFLEQVQIEEETTLYSLPLYIINGKDFDEKDLRVPSLNDSCHLVWRREDLEATLDDLKTSTAILKFTGYRTPTYENREWYVVVGKY